MGAAGRVQPLQNCTHVFSGQSLESVWDRFFSGKTVVLCVKYKDSTDCVLVIVEIRVR